MIDGPLEAEQRALIASRHLHAPFPQEAVADLLAVVRRVKVDAGETLMRQGDPGEDLFMVLAGHLTVQAELTDGSRRVLDEIREGDVVGEMALLTGQPRIATVVASVPCELGRLSRTDFERLSPRYPEALALLQRRLLARLRRTQLVTLVAGVFGTLDAAALDGLERCLQRIELAGGQRLFGEGDRGDDVYIVVNGRLRVTVADPSAPDGALAVEEVGPGGAVGEVALLTGEPRSATVTAVRDTDLLRLARADFDALLERHPRAMLAIVRAAAWRVRDSGGRARPLAGPTTFALLPARAGAPLSDLATALMAAWAVDGAALALDSATVDRRLDRPGIAQTPLDGPLHESMVAWLSDRERSCRHLLLVADGDDTPWTRRCLRHADRVLIVGRAGADPAPGKLEALLRATGATARVELVLVHGDATLRPSGTAAWLDARGVATHHHVRLGRPADVSRLARRLSGRPTGLVLGGGGARGFAHIGVLRALAEAGVEIDVVGGSSIGSVIAGAYAVGLAAADMNDLAKAFASRKAILDRTLPIVALMKGRKVTALYQRVYGETLIEDLWQPFFAVSSGLSRAEAVLHTRGLLWRAARASTAVPAIFPPLIGDDHEVLVDGNVMNNMPLDVMRAWCGRGTVIGVNPMPIEVKERAYSFGPSISGWDALRGRMHLLGSTIRAPSIFGAVMRATELNSANRMRQPTFRALADLLIEPPLGAFPIMEYGAWAPIVEVGYDAARTAIAAWRERGGDAPEAGSWRPEHESNVRPAP